MATCFSTSMSEPVHLSLSISKTWFLKQLQSHSLVWLHYIYSVHLHFWLWWRVGFVIWFYAFLFMLCHTSLKVYFCDLYSISSIHLLVLIFGLTWTEFPEWGWLRAVVGTLGNSPRGSAVWVGWPFNFTIKLLFKLEHLESEERMLLIIMPGPQGWTRPVLGHPRVCNHPQLKATGQGRMEGQRLGQGWGRGRKLWETELFRVRNTAALGIAQGFIIC